VKEAPKGGNEDNERPTRPRGMRRSLLVLYAVLAGINVGFVGLAKTLQHEVPAGMFEKADGTLIPIEDFDPVELGPFPKCHPHYLEHLAVDGKTWVNNSAVEAPEDKDALESFDFPVGHPLNKAWVEKRTAKMNAEALSFVSLQPSFHLLLVSVTVMFLACIHSVWLFAKPDPKLDGEDDVEKDEDMGQSALQDSDAYMFPIMGSATLLGLFVVYKYLDSDWIKFFFSCYVVFMCTNGLAINAGQVVAVLTNSRGLGKFTALFTVPYFDLRVTLVDLVAYLASAALGVFYIQTKNWIVNNVMGLSFCLLGIKLIGIAKYRTGVIMLCGLFLYDVFFVFYSKSVFGSNVMVTVATGVEAPIKLLFPRSQDGCGNLTFSMLGLGDIVVPGITISLLAKFDLCRPDASSKPGWAYLMPTMVSYALSLVTTVAVMLIWNHAQPALLYIVPFIIVSSFLTALFKGQVKDLFAFEVHDDSMIALDGGDEKPVDTKKDK